jgi:8-oxo-dGTP pyrophosphatase MutT (NUDIX family)
MARRGRHVTAVIREPYREVAAAILVGTCGRLLLQRRDDIPGLLYAGQIGLFGGHREDGETPLDCVRRELEEETGLLFAEERFTRLVELRANYGGSGGLMGSYFIVDGVPIDDVVVTEGSPFVTTVAELPSLLSRMTPSACYVARLYLEARRTDAG